MYSLANVTISRKYVYIIMDRWEVILISILSTNGKSYAFNINNRLNNIDQ